MADNVNITPGVGASVAADDVGGQLYQRVKPAFGADGYAIDVSASNPMPVIIASGVIYDSLENMRQQLASMNRRWQMNRVSALGHQWVTFDTNSNLNTVSTVTTVSTVANISNIQSVNTYDSVRAWNRAAYNTGVRSNLTIT